MNKLLILCGSLLIWNAATVTKEKELPTSYGCDTEISLQPSYVTTVSHTPVSFVVKEAKDAGTLSYTFMKEKPKGSETELNLASIVYIAPEEDEVVEVGFDTCQYLPWGFDAYAIDLRSISYTEEEEPIALGFDTAAYLPAAFNPYEPYFDFRTLPYVEEEEAIELGFDTTTYLPAGFNPYASDLDIRTLQYIEEESEVELGFDPQKYLPRDFDPYAKPATLTVK